VKGLLRHGEAERMNCFVSASARRSVKRVGGDQEKVTEQVVSGTWGVDKDRARREEESPIVVVTDENVVIK